MKPGDWVMVEGYDELEVDLALVIATSSHVRRLTDDEIRKECAANHSVPLKTDKWFSVLKADSDHLGDESSFHSEGSGARWVEVMLCQYDEAAHEQ